jgi:hypothetical protein
LKVIKEIQKDGFLSGKEKDIKRKEEKKEGRLKDL